MDKTYWAVVAAARFRSRARSIPVETDWQRHGGGERGERTAPAERDDEDAARAITEYRTLDHAARKLAWLELKPHTGRTHQLRVHCVAIRAPILGDVKYARPDQNNAFAATVSGLSEKMHLHARSLVFPHPAGESCGWKPACRRTWWRHSTRLASRRPPLVHRAVRGADWWPNLLGRAARSGSGRRSPRQESLWWCSWSPGPWIPLV